MHILGVMRQEDHQGSSEGEEGGRGRGRRRVNWAPLLAAAAVLTMEACLPFLGMSSWSVAQVIWGQRAAVSQETRCCRDSRKVSLGAAKRCISALAAFTRSSWNRISVCPSPIAHRQSRVCVCSSCSSSIQQRRGGARTLISETLQRRCRRQSAGCI